MDTSIPELQLPAQIKKRRSSWFSAVRSENQVFLSRHNSDVDEIPDSDEQRGRDPDPDKVTVHPPRPHSTPRTAGTSLPVTPGEERDDPYMDTHLSPQSAQRSSTQNSPREHGKSKSIDSSARSPDIASTPSKTNANGSTSSSPHSFLSTLKSRAGDKQALSNTAKEAMRKWGVNWANLRKDSSKQPTSDDSSEHGTIGLLIGSRLQPDSHSSIANRTRASYAEVRAAVEERKGKDKNSDSRPSSPIPIPGSSTDVTQGNSLVAMSQGSNPWSFPDSIVRSNSSASSSGHLSVSEKTHSSRKSSPTRIPFESDVQDGLEPVQPPIHVSQPQPKTMTIPGIHASHRGEIMSMGYVAPQPQPEGKASIQSVYRLWKSPTLSGQDQQQGALSQTHQSSDSQNPDTDSRELERGQEVWLPPSPPHAPSRPVPPPLPPRSTPVAISRPPLEPSSNPPSEASASQTLKSIANKDDRKRALENGIAPSTVTHMDVEPLVSASSSDSGNSDNSPPKTPSSAKSRSISNPGPPLPPRRIPS